MNVPKPRILIITGEASGDLHGGNLARALKAQAPDATTLAERVKLYVWAPTVDWRQKFDAVGAAPATVALEAGSIARIAAVLRPT